MLGVPVGARPSAAARCAGLVTSPPLILAGLGVGLLLRIGRVQWLIAFCLDHAMQLVDLGHVDDRLRGLGLLAAKCAGPPAHVMADRMGLDLDRDALTLRVLPASDVNPP